MTLRALLSILLFAAIACSGVAYAESAQESPKGERGAGGSRGDGDPDRSGDPLVTMTGKVTLLRRAGGAEGNPSGAPVITMQTEDAGEIIFHVGPPFFRKANDFPIEVGDTLIATGWRDKSAGYDSLLAKTVKNGDKTLEVRDEKGQRLWQRPDPADDGAPFETITGEIIGFGMKAHEAKGSVADTGDNGVVLIRAAEGEVFAHVGPASYRQKEGLQLAIGDQITVRAWRIDARMSNRPFVLARAVVKGDTDIEVRTDRRKPLWK